MDGTFDEGGIKLRDLCKSDLPKLVNIHESIKYYERLAGETFQQEEAQMLIEKKDLPPNGSQDFLKAKMIQTLDNQPAGYLVIYEGYPRQNDLWIGALFLHRKFHHQGLGSMVIKAVEANAAECGFQTLGLGVYGQNYAGLRFWLKQGFNKIESVSVNKHQRVLLRLTKIL